ncbi:hypothetical protein F4803DRAFT_498641 [Xylaria telfairii]|nr:hypothetical protein F4803DRAFT_498641 [Xylaria telfairii]
MKISTVAIAALAATAQAAVISRDASTVSDLLESVFQSMTNADNHVLDFQNDPEGLHEAGYALLDTLECNTKVAKAMEYLSVHDVACISEVSGRVSSLGTKFLGDIEAAVPHFAAYGVCEYAYDFAVRLSKSSLSNRPLTGRESSPPYLPSEVLIKRTVCRNWSH